MSVSIPNAATILYPFWTPTSWACAMGGRLMGSLGIIQVRRPRLAVRCEALWAEQLLGPGWSRHSGAPQRHRVRRPSTHSSNVAHSTGAAPLRTLPKHGRWHGANSMSGSGEARQAPYSGVGWRHHKDTWRPAGGELGALEFWSRQTQGRQGWSAFFAPLRSLHRVRRVNTHPWVARATEWLHTEK